MNKFLKLITIFLICNSSNIISSDQQTNIKKAKEHSKKAGRQLAYFKKYGGTAVHKLLAIEHLVDASEIYYGNYMNTGNIEYLMKAKLYCVKTLKIYASIKQELIKLNINMKNLNILVERMQNLQIVLKGHLIK